jgi:surface antigen
MRRNWTDTFHKASRLASLAAAALVFVAFALAGCGTTHAQQGEVIGGVVGGVLGSQVGEGSGKTAAIIVGTLAGSMIGRHIGESMDDTDRIKTANSLNNARTGQSTTWVNPDTGYEYTVTPTRTYEDSGGPCREFRLDATVGDEPDQDVHGTACLQSDGSWLIR